MKTFILQIINDKRQQILLPLILQLLSHRSQIHQRPRRQLKQRQLQNQQLQRVLRLQQPQQQQSRQAIVLPVLILVRTVLNAFLTEIRIIASVHLAFKVEIATEYVPSTTNDSISRWLLILRDRKLAINRALSKIFSEIYWPSLTLKLSSKSVSLISEMVEKVRST